MNSEELENVFRKWNPELDSVSLIKEALDKYGSFEMAFKEPSLVESIVHIPIAVDFEEEVENLPPEKEYNILTCDYNGNCLIIDDDKTEIKHISEFY